MVARVATREEKNPLVDVLLEAVRLEIVALVVVELPTMRLVMVARVATREEMKELVLVALVEATLVEKRLVLVLFVVEALEAVRLVVVAFTPLKFVVKKFVEDPLVISEVEAKIFCAKRLRNLLNGVPIEYVISAFGTTSPTDEVPETVRDVIEVVARVEVP
jgi:hypothetical protein